MQPNDEQCANIYKMLAGCKEDVLLVKAILESDIEFCKTVFKYGYEHNGVSFHNWACVWALLSDKHGYNGLNRLPSDEISNGEI